MSTEEKQSPFALTPEQLSRVARDHREMTELPQTEPIRSPKLDLQDDDDKSTEPDA